MENKAHNKLRAWKKSERRTWDWVASECGISNSAIRAIGSGAYLPSRPVAMLIERLTDGAVKEGDWK